MGVISAEWQHSAIQMHQAHGTETPVRTRNIFPNDGARIYLNLTVELRLEVEKYLDPENW